MKNIALLFLVVTLLASCTATKTQVKEEVPITEVTFIKSGTFEQVLEKAKAANKLVFIDFYIDACPPCRVMDETAFTDESVFEYYNENFINFKVDAIDFDYIPLAQQFEVREYPTLVYVDGDGKMLVRHYGGASATNLLDLAKNAVSQKPVM